MVARDREISAREKNSLSSLSSHDTCYLLALGVHRYQSTGRYLPKANWQITDLPKRRLCPAFALAPPPHVHTAARTLHIYVRTSAPTEADPPIAPGGRGINFDDRINREQLAGHST